MTDRSADYHDRELFEDLLLARDRAVEVVLVQERHLLRLMEAWHRDDPRALEVIAIIDGIIEDNVKPDIEQLCIVCDDEVKLMESPTTRGGGVPGYVKPVVTDPAVRSVETIGFVVCKRCAGLERGLLRDRVVAVVAESAGEIAAARRAAGGSDTIVKVTDPKRGSLH